MKVERNILSKENLAELEDLVNRLDDATEEVLQSIPIKYLEKLLERKKEEYRKLLIEGLRACDKRIKEKKAQLAKLKEK